MFQNLACTCEADHFSAKIIMVFADIESFSKDEIRPQCTFLKTLHIFYSTDKQWFRTKPMALVQVKLV